MLRKMGNPDTPEFKTLSSYQSELLQCIQRSPGIAGRLEAGGIIATRHSQGRHRVSDQQYSTEEEAHDVMGAVINEVLQDPRVYHQFIQNLNHADPFIADVVRKLPATYSSQSAHATSRSQ